MLCRAFKGNNNVQQALNEAKAILIPAVAGANTVDDTWAASAEDRK